MNNLSIKAKVGLAALPLILAFAGGRYSVQKPDVKTQEVASQIDMKKENQNVVTKTHEVATKTPDGTIQTVTDTTTQQVTQTTEQDKDTESLKQTVTQPKGNKLNVSALLAYHYGDKEPAYGASVTKEILGPVTIGLFGLSNGTVGASVGLDF